MQAAGEQQRSPEARGFGPSTAARYHRAAIVRESVGELGPKSTTSDAQQNYPGNAMLIQRQAPIRVLIVEQRPVLSPEVRSALERNPRFVIVGESTSAAEATRVARNQRPDVALCEATLPDPGAVELARFFRLRLPSTTMVYVTLSSSEEELFEAVQVGAAAYLPGSLEARAFLTALVRVTRGEFVIDEEVMRQPAVASRVLSLFRLSTALDCRPNGWSAQAAALDRLQQTPSAREAFTPLFAAVSAREVEILDLVARGNSNKLIARLLGISDQTVKNHITTILKKLEVNDRTEAVVCALRNGWIRIDAPSIPGGSSVARARRPVRRTGRLTTPEYGHPAQAGG
jgi:DNA-binding NarL/FixJ family response regulator